MEPRSLNEDIYFNLDRAALLLRRKILDVVSEYEVSPEQWEILALLGEQGSLSQTDLTRATMKDKGNVSRLVARMERDGWIERRHPPGTKRTVMVTLTQKGRAMRSHLPSLLSRQVDELLSPLGASEQGELLFALKKLRIVLGDEDV